MHTDKPTNKGNILKLLRNIIVIVFWLLLVILCFLNRDKITVEGILSFTPQNIAAAMLIMFLLFAVKSVTFFIYGGILYAASGIMFPLPVAVLVNLIGTVIMTSIPFFIGKKGGTKTIDKIIEKYPRLKILRDIPNNNELFVSFFVRIVGCIPADPLGIYLGASGIRYSKYICGTLLGLSSAIITFSVMGMSINDVTSPAFIISAVSETGIMILSVSIYLLWRNRNKKKSSSNEFKVISNGGQNDTY